MNRDKVVVLAAAVTTAVAVVAVGVVLNKWKKKSERRWKHTQRILRKFARDCATPVPKLWHVAYDLVNEMNSGLSSDTNQSSLNMLPSYGYPLPSGDEKGLYYGVNLREEHFLILRAGLGGKNEPILDMQREEITIPLDKISSTTKELFAYIALKLATSISQNADTGISIQRILGFTVSFPLMEEAAASSEMARKWKSFSANDAAGKELVDEINQALQEFSVNARVVAFVDDTIGNLAGGRYFDKDTVAAITLGIATNAAYLESAENVPKWNGHSSNSGEIVVNMQWGRFSSGHFPTTEFDNSLDFESSDPGCRIFEKLISGKYLGEIVRRVLLQMAQETALFGESVPPKLKIPFLLRSPDMAAMHQDITEDRETVDEKLNEIFGISNSTPMVREVVAEVCDIVAERGARLAGAGVVGIIKKLDRQAKNRSVVIVEGGLYEHYRIFRNYLHSAVWEMLGNELSDNVIVEHSHGGSGAGTIFLAASQSQIQAS